MFPYDASLYQQIFSYPSLSVLLERSAAAFATNLQAIQQSTSHL